MPKFLIHIGSRALEIVAPSIGEAGDAALEKYPGEIISGWTRLADENTEPDSAELERESDPEGRAE